MTRAVTVPPPMRLASASAKAVQRGLWSQEAGYGQRVLLRVGAAASLRCSVQLSENHSTFRRLLPLQVHIGVTYNKSERSGATRDVTVQSSASRQGVPEAIRTWPRQLGPHSALKTVHSRLL